MIILKYKSKSKYIIAKQKKVVSIVTSFYKENFNNLCRMKIQQIESELHSLLMPDNSIDTSYVYLCEVWKVHDDEQLPFSYLKKGEKISDKNFYIEYKNIYIKKPAIVYEIVVAFKGRGTHNNYLVTFLVEIDTSLKTALSFKLSNVDKVEML